MSVEPQTPIFYHRRKKDPEPKAEEKEPVQTPKKRKSKKKAVVELARPAKVAAPILSKKYGLVRKVRF